ncbi:MAG: hypothetical protein ACR2OZ_04520 [Verrucomicrobiales bacterium]
MALLIFVGAAGVIAGWLLKGNNRDKPPVGPNGSGTRSGHSELALGSKRGAAVTSPRVNEVLADMNRATQRAAHLSPAAFAERMAELMAHPHQIGALVERAAMASLLDADRIAAMAELYKQRGEVAPIDRELLTIVGQKDGRNAVMRLTELHPTGFVGIDSLVHGWAMTEPTESVQWFNSLPVDSPLRDLSLRGLMWGLTVGSSETAAKVLPTLAPEDQQIAADSFAGALTQYRRLDELDAWLSSADPTLVAHVLRGVARNTAYVPRGELVPFLARHVQALDHPNLLASQFNSWAFSSPQAAFDWMATWSGDPQQPNPQAEQLAASLDPALCHSWVTAHPDHPASPRLRARLQTRK